MEKWGRKSQRGTKPGKGKIKDAQTRDKEFVV